MTREPAFNAAEADHRNSVVHADLDYFLQFISNIFVNLEYKVLHQSHLEIDLDLGVVGSGVRSKEETCPH